MTSASPPGTATDVARLPLSPAMLANLQAWVSGYYEREDAWSYRAHRRIFDAFGGRKTEHVAPVADGRIDRFACAAVDRPFDRRARHGA